MITKPYLLSALTALLLIFSSCVKNLSKPNTQGQGKTLPRAAATYSFDLPIRVSTPFIWGVNGHPLWPQGSVYYGNLPLQMHLLNMLQAPWYRVDFNMDTSGRFTSPGAAALFAAAADSGVNIFPILIWDSALVYSLPQYQAESAGQTAGQGFVALYGPYMTQHYYEVGNEEDLVIDKNGLSYVAYYYFKGMCEGIKQADPLAQIVINSAGEHADFFGNLVAQQVPFDIIGIDFYKGASELATALNDLQTNYGNFGKKVWLTELNNYVAADPNNNVNTANVLRDQIQALDLTAVSGVFMYELFDQDELKSEHNIESTLGLVSLSTPSPGVNIKPVGSEYQFRIEETNNGWADFAYATFLYCDFRQPDPGGLQSWTNWFTTNRNIPLAFNIILPQENYMRWVDQQFELLLGRAADPGGESWWTQQLVNGATRESVIETFVGGPEFWQISGSNNTGLVDRAYQVLLGRPYNNPPTQYGPDPDWVDELNNGNILPWQMAQGILRSVEYQTNYVTHIFNTVLNRAPDPGGLSFWVGQMQQGMDQLDVYQSFLNGPEFYQQAINQGYERSHPGYPI